MSKGKRQIIGSMFPEKLTFTKNGYRTARVNEAVRLIFNVGEDFSEIKNGTTDEKSLIYHEVIRLVSMSIERTRTLPINRDALPPEQSNPQYISWISFV